MSLHSLGRGRGEIIEEVKLKCLLIFRQLQLIFPQHKTVTLPPEVERLEGEVSEGFLEGDHISRVRRV